MTAGGASLGRLDLLEVRQGDGTYLSSTTSSLLPQIVEWGIMLGEQHILDLVEARQEIEISLAGLAAGRRTDADVAALSAALQAMRESVGDRDAYIEADVNFHMVLATISRNSVLAGVLTSIRSLLRVWTTRVVTDRASLALHPPVFAAVRDVHGCYKDHKRMSIMNEEESFRPPTGARARCGTAPVAELRSSCPCLPIEVRFTHC